MFVVTKEAGLNTLTRLGDFQSVDAARDYIQVQGNDGMAVGTRFLVVKVVEEWVIEKKLTKL